MMLSGWFRVMVDISLVGRGLSFGPVGSVGSELDHRLGAAAGHGADELAGEVHLEHGGVQLDGDDLAGEVPAGCDLLVADPEPAIVAEPVPDLFASRVCSFCKKAAEHLFGEQYPKTDRNFAIIDGVWICDECVARFARLLAQEDPGFLAQESPGTPS